MKIGKSRTVSAKSLELWVKKKRKSAMGNVVEMRPPETPRCFFCDVEEDQTIEFHFLFLDEKWVCVDCRLKEHVKYIPIQLMPAPAGLRALRCDLFEEGIAYVQPVTFLALCVSESTIDGKFWCRSRDVMAYTSLYDAFDLIIPERDGCFVTFLDPGEDLKTYARRTEQVRQEELKKHKPDRLKQLQAYLKKEEPERTGRVVLKKHQTTGRSRR